VRRQGLDGRRGQSLGGDWLFQRHLFDGFIALGDMVLVPAGWGTRLVGMWMTEFVGLGCM
jgi:hypothetical protein